MLVSLLGSLSIFQAVRLPFVHTISLRGGTAGLMSGPPESTPGHAGWHSGNAQTLLTLTVWLLPPPWRRPRFTDVTL